MDVAASQCGWAPPTPNLRLGESRVPIRRRVTFVCGNAQAASGNDEGWNLSTASGQPSSFMRSTAVFMFASFALGIRAASASSSTFQGELHGYECLPVIMDSVSASSVSADVDASRCTATSRCTIPYEADAKDIGLWTTVRRFMQAQKTKDEYVCDAHEAYRDNLHKNPRVSSVENMQDALTKFPVLKNKSAFDRSSEDFIRGTAGSSADGKDVGKPSHEWESSSFKLTVPLKIVSLRGSLPPIWLKDFLLSQGKRVRISVQYQNSLNEILSALRSAVEKKDVKPMSNLTANLVTVGDSWLPLAVSGGLIQPILNAEQQDWFNRLGANWQAFVRRDEGGSLHPKGLIWGVPYRWGCMVIAYKKDQFLKNNIPAIEDWEDLWKPELKGQIAMVDSPREVVGAVLKSLGASYNAQDFDHDVKGGRAAVKQQFLTLQKQVKVFDSVHYLKAFGLDDVWVAVGWSSDVIPVVKRMSNTRVVTPKSGVSLWADLWAIPTTNLVAMKKIGSQVHGVSPLVHQWFDFCLQPARGLPFQQGIFMGVSPLFFLKGDTETKLWKHGPMTDTLGKATDVTFGAVNNSTTGPAMDTNMIEGMPPKDCLEKSEMLEPLSEKAKADYRWLLSEITQQDSSRKELEETVKHFFNVAARSSTKG